MKSLFSILLYLIFSVFSAQTQITEAILDIVPYGVDDQLVERGIAGFVDYRYSGEVSLASDDPNHISVAFLDSLGNIAGTADFDRFGKLEEYSQNFYGAAGELVKTNYYGTRGKLLWSKGFCYDISGRLVECIEYAGDGKVDGKSLYFYNDEGLLYKVRQLDHEGRLSFWRIIRYSDQKVPEHVSLKQARGFTMSNITFHYDTEGVLKEKKVFAGLKGQISGEEFEYDNHLLYQRRSYNNGSLDAVTVRRYVYDGMRRVLKKEGLETGAIIFQEYSPDTLLYGYQSKATFPGGKLQLVSHLQKMVAMPEGVLQQGVVIVGFTVRENGKLRKIRIEKGLSSMINEKAIEIVRRMPRWKPGFDSEGAPQNTEVYLPLIFVK